MPRLIHDPDGLIVTVVPRDNLLDSLPQALLVPVRQRQKLLQRPRRHLSQMRHRFHALAWKVAELPLHVVLQMASRVKLGKAVGELGNESRQRRLQRDNLLGGHP